MPAPIQVIVRVVKFFFARTTEEGAIALVSAAAGGPETHGEFMSVCKVKPPGPFVLSEKGAETQERVWDELVKKLEIISPGISSNITAV